MSAAREKVGRRAVLRSYEHIEYPDARRAERIGRAKRFRVITVNWSIATNHAQSKRQPIVPRSVHLNVYDMTLVQLVKFIRETGDVAEDVVSVEPL